MEIYCNKTENNISNVKSIDIHFVFFFFSFNSIVQFIIQLTQTNERHINIGRANGVV